MQSVSTQHIDRGRSIPVSASAGRRFGERSYLDAALSSYNLMTDAERARFHEIMKKNMERK